MERMSASQRFQAYFAGEPVDRMPVIEWAPFWNLTLERWRADGVPAEALQSVESLQEY